MSHKQTSPMLTAQKSSFLKFVIIAENVLLIKAGAKRRADLIFISRKDFEFNHFVE